MARTSASARVLTDPDEIRRWAEERGANPACVRGTGGNGDVGMIRLDFPGYSGDETLEEISWDDWFGKFNESKLALFGSGTNGTRREEQFQQAGLSRNRGARFAAKGEQQGFEWHSRPLSKEECARPKGFRT
jgi:hypothetical protein